MPFTRGFRTRFLLDRHFRYHGVEVGAASAPIYQEKAAAFLGVPLVDPVRECVQASDGALIRWNRDSNEFGVLGADGAIETYS